MKVQSEQEQHQKIELKLEGGENPARAQPADQEKQIQNLQLMYNELQKEI